MNEYLPAIKEFKKDLATKNGKKAELWKAIDKEIIVTKGNFDRVEAILDELEINYTAFDYGISPKANLRPQQILLVNCPGEGIDSQVVERFVSCGGWLVTTDWALTRVVAGCFPRTIGSIGKTHDDVVEIEPTESAITKGIQPKSQFWLETSFLLIDVIDTESVKVLIRSAELKQKYGSDVIMVGFNWGKGKVFHSLSHFILQKSKSGKTRLEDAYSSLVLLTNILAQRKLVNI
jgi:hypothetical protein